MAGVHDAALLGSFLAEHEDRIVRRAARSLRHALDEGYSREHRKTAVPSYTGELASLLLERGEEAPRLWGEAVRHHGSVHFENRIDVGDLVREFQALHGAILEEWDKRAGPMGSGVELLLSECITEGAASAVSDYVRRVRGEQVEFRESALIETILEHLDEGILLVEADGTLSFATRPAFRLMGEGLRASIGSHITEPAMGKFLSQLKASTLIDGEPVIPSRLPAVKTLQTGESPGPTLMRVETAGGERILELTAIPIWDADRPGDPKRDLRGVITTVRDRTEDIRKTEELREKSRELADLHSRMLRRSRAQAMGELATGTAHTLNNVLNSMHLRLRLLREAPSPDKFEALGKSVNELAELVARLQQFAAQKPSGPVESSDLDARIHEALALVRPEGRRTGEGVIHVRSDLQHPPAVRANDTELRELLVSLLLYARDEIGAGGELDVATGVSGRNVECRLQYHGRERLRPEALLAPLLEEGAGPRLGLALGSAREALRRWGGDLQVRTLDTGGAEITMTFAPADFIVEHHGPPMPAVDTGHRRVLVIDDDPDNASMLAEVLAAEGHITDTATTGQEAIQKWEGGTFDVALVDLLMPDMPGTEIAAALRTTRPDARIALVTGWELDEQQRRTAPVHAVFRKPVDLSQLLAFLVPPEAQPAATP